MKIGDRVEVRGRGDNFDGRAGVIASDVDQYQRFGVKLDQPPTKPAGMGPASAWRTGVFWIHRDSLREPVAAQGRRVLVADGISTGVIGTVMRRAEDSPLGIPFWRVSLDGLRERDIRADFLEPAGSGSES